MRRLGITEFRDKLDDVLADVQASRANYIITKNGKPAAIVIPFSQAEEADREERRKAWKELAELLAEAGRTAQAEYSTEEIMKWARE